MFGNIDQLEEMKKKLNSVSPSFCMAKWKHVTIHLLNGHTHSCYLPQTHPIPLKEIEKDPSALHNTQFKKLQRKKMLEGKRPDECKICWSVEDLPGNQTSDRHFRGVDSWTMPFFEEVKDLPWDANVYPSYLEVSFSYLCNFKCTYCSPHVSSRWMDEIRKEGPYHLSEGRHQNLTWLKKNGFMPVETEQNPYVEAFWKWWPDLVRHLMYFRITGGEPLLAEDTFKTLEWLNENPQPELDLSINSNMGVPARYVDRFIGSVQKLVNGRKIKAFMLHTSMDTFGEQAEYIRTGLDFESFRSNLERYLSSVPTASVAFMSTFNNLSIVGYRKFLDWVLELRRKYNNENRQILLDIPHLMGPGHQAVNMLTEDYQSRMEELIAYMEANLEPDYGFKPAEVDKMNRILAWMRTPLPPRALLRARRDFYLFFSEADRRRGTQFLKTFPEMEEFWKLCESLVLGPV